MWWNWVRKALMVLLRLAWARFKDDIVAWVDQRLKEEEKPEAGGSHESAAGI